MPEASRTSYLNLRLQSPQGNGAKIKSLSFLEQRARAYAYKTAMKRLVVGETKIVFKSKKRRGEEEKNDETRRDDGKKRPRAKEKKRSMKKNK